MKTIGPFTKEWRWLSNFYECEITYKGKIYPTVEHAYQASKSEFPDIREGIRLLKTPVEAKRAGQKIKLRPRWGRFRFNIMKKLLKLKFPPNSYLGKKLQKTGDAEIVEYNAWHDNYWGSCICNNCHSKTKFNRLGQLLMIIREENKCLNGK
jgi:ribA/ribD-fused uncharacterized protein